ncbi:MAG TPA: phosphoribosylformylglycinamidine synthase subunit PurL, partial [Chloroflexota bacterium]|nr:phosphoribosylformylglycinamidine synthase subunit PurL [Chloroflexota bacterium]
MAARALAVAGRPEAVCRAGKRFQIDGDVPEANRPAVERVLGNHLIHDFSWVDDGSIAVPGAVRRSLGSSETTASGDVAPHVRTIDLSGRDEAALMATSQAESLALDVSEMTAIQSTFDELGRPPTDVELQSIALAWSEHCSHKTFKAIIEFEQDGRVEVIDGLLAECLVRVTRELNRSWVRSAFVDNAGVIAFDGEYDLAIKVETHNHPSALEPYAGAHTGVGGVIRDILAVSADPIANTDVLCFGPPSLRADSLAPGVTHPARTFREVVRGIADYGNNMGIPTVGGGVWFDAGYTANPLVFCGTVGIAPRGSHPTSPAKGDAIVLIGGRTGRDGIHGATMSSERLDRATAKGSTVQIGAPITEKLLRDVIPHLRDGHMYSAITDCGAGGLCSAVGEMAASLGAEVDLALVPLKYQDLAPWEIWLSEAQERLVLAVPHDRLLSCLRMCTASGVEAAVIGVFREDGQLRLTFGDQGVADLDLGFMQKGCPRRRLKARWTKGHETTATDPPSRASISHEDTLLLLLAHPNIASKEQVIRRYDHEVQGGTFGKPITAGGGPSDAAVLKPREDSWSGAVIAHGVNPLYGIEDPHAMATLAVDEALRNLVAVGGDIDHVALVDNFCWGNVDDPEELGSLVRAAQGCRDAAMLFGTPFISGKDSLRNTSISASDVGNVPRVQSIPGTLLVSALGVVADLRRCVTMDLKSTDSAVFVLGRTDEELGGSHFKLIHGWGDGVPALRDVTPDVMRKLTAAINAGQVLSCHDMSEGGLAVAAAEMVIGGCIGLALDADRLVGGEVSTAGRLFSESSGRLIVEVSAGCADAFEAAFDGLPCARIGKTQPDARLEISSSGEKLVNLGVEALAHAWRTPLLPDTEFHEDAEAQERAESEPISLGAAPDRTASIAVAPVRHTKSIAVMVLTTPGTNCERETASACRMAGANPEIVPMDQLLRGERRLHEA